MPRVAPGLLLALAGCGGAPPPAEPLSNHVAPAPAPPQRLAPLVIEELGTCTTITVHHIAITLDGAPVATVDVPCQPPPRPNAQGIVIIESDNSPQYTAPAFEVPPGRHRIAVRDDVTGLEDAHDARFPLHGSLAAPTTPDRGLPVDTVVVVVHTDWIRLDIAVRANLIVF